jgi:hydroxyacylglutathione hydrolase
VGTERRTNRLAPFVAAGDAAGFAGAVLRDLPVVPAYWPRMRPRNMTGPRPLRDVGGVPGWPGLLAPRPLDARDVREQVAQERVYVVDTREAAGFGGAHIAGAFGVGLGPSFGVWVGSVVPDDRPLVLVLPGCEEGASPALAAAWEAAVRQLLRVGYERVAGYLAGGMRAWAGAGFPFEEVPQLSAAAAADRVRRDGVRLLDVRQPGEWRTGHAAEARHLPAAALPARLAASGDGDGEEIAPDARWAVVCSTGYRSTVAASLLRRAGVREVANVLGGMDAWAAAGLPVTAAAPDRAAA